MENRKQQDARHRQLVAGYYENHDEGPLNGLLAELRPRLTDFLRSKSVRDAEQLEDVVQETLAQVLVGLRVRQYRPAVGSVATWAVQICWHRFIDSQRLKANVITRPDSHNNTFLRLADTLTLPPERLAEQQEAAQRAGALVAAATQAVLQLDPSARAAVVLHYYQGLPVPEAAARMGVDEQQYRARLSRGLAALRAWGESQPHPSGEVYASLPHLHTGDLFTEPLRLAG